ncbi:MAG TPA: serine protease [bacterium]|nr:serine protease [bacterium]
MTHREREFHGPHSRMRLALIAVAASLCCGTAPTLSSGAAPAAGSVFVLVTMDKTTWVPYEYGSAFFFNTAGDAYTASHVVTTVVRLPYTMLVAIVGGLEYAVHVVCWNPRSGDRARTFTRDVAIVHVGPEVPLFPIGVYHPAVAPLVAVPLHIRSNRLPRPGEAASVVGFRLDHGFAWEHNIAFPRHESQGHVARVLRTLDGTAVVTVAFTAGAVPENGESGGPILDSRGDVLGLAAWERADASTSSEISGLGAPSLGCFTRIPPGEEQLSPRDTPLRLP